MASRRARDSATPATPPDPARVEGLRQACAWANGYNCECNTDTKGCPAVLSLEETKHNGLQYYPGCAAGQWARHRRESATAQGRKKLRGACLQTASGGRSSEGCGVG